MKNIILFITIIFVQACSKPQTILICGDHKCVNKDEANQYFENNLTLEVKIINNKKKDNFDLIELNMADNKNKKEISLVKKRNTDKKIKLLNAREIKEIKRKVKEEKKVKKDNKKKLATKINKNNKKIEKFEKVDRNISLNRNENRKKINDICTILEKCSIDEISKYLIKEGKKKNFPDLSIRE